MLHVKTYYLQLRSFLIILNFQVSSIAIIIRYLACIFLIRILKVYRAIICIRFQVKAKVKVKAMAIVARVITI